MQPPRPMSNPKIKLPTLRRPTSIPTGPRLTKPIPINQQPIVQGPGDPPPGFLTARTSVTEWYVYWGLSKIFTNPLDPRQPPFLGGWPDWNYQYGMEGPGAVVDFIVNNPGNGMNSIALRIVTEYWHLYTTAQKQATDELQKEALGAYYTVVDMYDFDFINDPSGQATIVTLKNVLGLTERPNPLWLGTTLRGSRMDRVGGH